MTTPEASVRHRVAQTEPGSTAAVPDLPGWTQFAIAAETAGIESVLISISRHEPDPLLVACALGCAVKRLSFIVAYRSGLILPTTFVQQINTLSSLLNGRVAVNMVAGSSRPEQRAYGDDIAHDDRYARADEFLALCRALWFEGANSTSKSRGIDFQGDHYQVSHAYFPTPFVESKSSCRSRSNFSSTQDRHGPELYVSGHSERAEQLALARGSCWLRTAEPPETIADLVARTRERGVEVGLRLCVLCRDTREEVLETIDALVPHSQPGVWHTDKRDDSTMYAEARSRPTWLSERLWAGLVPACGPVWTTLAGTPREIADAFLEYRRIGVTQFILSSWPELSEVSRFGRSVIPIVRQAESNS